MTSAGPSIVLDNGSMYLRAGFAGAEAPELCFPSLVGRAKHARIMLQPSSSADLDYVGQVAMDNRGLLRLEQPVDRGCVRNWDAMERVWKHAFQRLGATAGQHPVLLTEPVQNPRRNRERAAEVLFETLQVPAFYVSHQCPLALYASGRTTGVVLDCGEGVTQAMPIFNGFALPHATVRSDVGGKDVTDVLMLHLRRAGLALHTSAERQIVREMKEACCFVALGVVKDELASTKPYRLPDGRIVDLGAERHRAAEVLFNPSLVGLEYRGAHETLTECIFKADLDLRRELLASIVLAGGSSLTPGFGERLVGEIKTIASKHTRMGGPPMPGDEALDAAMKIRVAAPPNRTNLVWVGGSILASLAAFKTMWIKKSRFDEVGAALAMSKDAMY